MKLTGGPFLRFRRVLIVSLALVANLVATGVPVLHAWTHEVEHAHDADPAPEPTEHSHDEAHPPQLHDDCLAVHRVSPDVSPALPATSTDFVSLAAGSVPAVHAVVHVSSRAPPAPTRARAPPSA